MLKLKTDRKEKICYYATIYGNTVRYIDGEDMAYDLDMRMEVPVDMVDFDSPIYG